MGNPRWRYDDFPGAIGLADEIGAFIEEAFADRVVRVGAGDGSFTVREFSVVIDGRALVVMVRDDVGNSV